MQESRASAAGRRPDIQGSSRAWPRELLHNSNGGLVAPVSAGLDLKFASIRQCNLYAVAAGTVAFYQNPRTDRDYFKFGPVPGVTLGCGRVKVNGIIVLQPERQFFDVIAASLTLMLH